MAEDYLEPPAQLDFAAPEPATGAGPVGDHQDLITRILALTKSPQSVPYYTKAIASLGMAAVEEELGELRFQMKTRTVQAPEKYFTTLLKNRFSSLNAALTRPLPKPQQATYSNKTYHAESALDLFRELRPINTKDKSSIHEGSMEVGYSSTTLPWATFIGPDFFTLSTNKLKSDRVTAKFRLKDGKYVEVPLYRGRFFPKDEETGILTPEEGRILGAMESIWVDQGCRYAKFENGGVACYCDVVLHDLARLLGWKSFGGSDINHLKKKALNLRRKGYFLDLEAIPELRDAGIPGFGFSLVDGFLVLDKRHKRDQVVIKIRFSDPFSRQLLERRVVSRPRAMLQIHGELAFLVRLYIEPILMSRGNGGEHSIELLNLIELLHLPPVGWHKIKSQRKIIFGRALHELKDMTTVDGDPVTFEIVQGKNLADFMLVARLPRPALPEKGGQQNT